MSHDMILGLVMVVCNIVAVWINYWLLCIFAKKSVFPRWPAPSFAAPCFCSEVGLGSKARSGLVVSPVVGASNAWKGKAAEGLWDSISIYATMVVHCFFDCCIFSIDTIVVIMSDCCDSGTPSPSMQPWWSTATSSVQCFLGDAFNQDEKELTSGEANDKERAKALKRWWRFSHLAGNRAYHSSFTQSQRNISRWGTIHTNKQTNKK